MNPKVEYISRLFQKTSYKALENYCLTRLWHKLDNDDIKLVPQQYVNRHVDKYALTDVYLPQFKIHIEVNEPAHYSFPERIKADEDRKLEIENKTGHKLFVIDCRKSLAEIHQEIDKIVDVVNGAFLDQKQKGTFKPWQPEKENTAEYWKTKSFITTTDDISLRSIEDICALFDADFAKTKRGFLRQGAIKHPRKNNYIIWWPAGNNRSGWSNLFGEDENTIIESHISPEKIRTHYNNLINTPELRIVFFYDKDEILGIVGYKYKGIYQIDKTNSSDLNGLVWKRVDLTFNFN